MSNDESDDQTFAQLQVDPRVVAAVTKLGFNAPTPIQAQAIPPLLEGRDLVGRARTGSGKTAAFGLPLIELLCRPGEGVRGLVLAPTRELALQITEALRSYSAGVHLKTVTLYGGSSYRPQLSALRRGVDLVVGTPGRLLDHLRRGSLDLSAVELVVIDEADEMLRMGFIDDLTEILHGTPETRQVALFSATMPAPIRAVAEKYLHRPLEVAVERQRLVVEHISQYRIDVPESHKVEALTRVLKSKPPGATLIFARTRVSCDELAEALRDRGFVAQALHGDMTQSSREDVLGALRTHRLGLVVATDVAARGIDVEHLSHVINYDLPEETEVYVNRIGRTGRAGREGVAISIVTRRDQRLLQRIEQHIKKRLKRRVVPSDAQIVRRQRAALEAALLAALELPTAASAATLAEQLQQGEDWSAERLAAAALGLLMHDRHLDIEAEPSDEPPAWARRPERWTDRRGPSRRGPDRRGPDHRGARGGGRDQGKRRALPGRPRDPHDRAEAEQATLAAPVGREHGIGPNDVVGALAHELGVPSRSIGRIKIFDRSLTVGVTDEIASALSRKPKTIFLRGNPVTFIRPGDDAPPARAPVKKNKGKKPYGRADEAPSGRADPGAKRGKHKHKLKSKLKGKRKVPKGGKRG